MRIGDCPMATLQVVLQDAVDPPWVLTEGWQGFSGQNSFIEFGKKPFAAATATTRRDRGSWRVIYASTRHSTIPGLLSHQLDAGRAGSPSTCIRRGRRRMAVYL